MDFFADDTYIWLSTNRKYIKFAFKQIELDCNAINPLIDYCGMVFNDMPGYLAKKQKSKIMSPTQ